MKTIVFCDQYGQLGGGQQVLLELVSAALANSLAVKVLVPAGPCADQLEAAGAEVRRIPACTLTQGRKKFADILYGTAYCLNVFLRNIAFLRSAELIYVNGNRLLPVALLAQSFLGKPAVCHGKKTVPYISQAEAYQGYRGSIRVYSAGTCAFRQHFCFTKGPSGREWTGYSFHANSF